MKCRLSSALVGALAGVVLAAPAGALVMVSLDVPETTVAVGATFEVTITAEFSDPIVGFGFDLVYDDLLLSQVGVPSIGLDWIGVVAADGDDLAGAAFPVGLAGPGILLATVTLHADAVGISVLSFETTTADLTEGFAFDPDFATGFDALAAVTPLEINIVPEPGTGTLVALGLFGLAGARRRWAR